MTFSIFEIGKSGRPVHLYEFTWGNTVWRYTSADREVTWDTVPWEPIAISDGGVRQGLEQSEFEITVPTNLELVALFRGTPPALPVQIRALRYHRDDPDAEARQRWSGTVGNVKRKSVAKSTIIGLSSSIGHRRAGKRLCWERGCTNILYGPGCNLDRNNFKNDTTITALTGTTIEVAGLGTFAAAEYAGGFFEWAANVDGTLDRRGIESSAGGNVFNVLGQTDRLEVGQAITMHPGCDLTAATCNDRFNNLVNRAGWDFMPGRSPFDGNPVM